MSDEQKVLEALHKNGSLDNEEDKVRGIAQRAVDNGYDNLSPPSKECACSFAD